VRREVGNLLLAFRLPPSEPIPVIKRRGPWFGSE
jgi:hypothetical protein